MAKWYGLSLSNMACHETVSRKRIQKMVVAIVKAYSSALSHRGLDHALRNGAPWQNLGSINKKSGTITPLLLINKFCRLVFWSVVIRVNSLRKLCWRILLFCSLGPSCESVFSFSGFVVTSVSVCYVRIDSVILLALILRRASKTSGPRFVMRSWTIYRCTEIRRSTSLSLVLMADKRNATS